MIKHLKTAALLVSDRHQHMLPMMTTHFKSCTCSTVHVVYSQWLTRFKPVALLVCYTGVFNPVSQLSNFNLCT